MLYAADFRKQAYNALAGRWGVAVGTGFVAALLGGASEPSFNFPNFNYRWNDTSSFYYNAAFWPVFLMIIGFILIYALILFFIGGAVTLGYAQFNINVIDRTEPRFRDLFSKFHMFWTGFVMQFFTGLFIFLWTLLFIIPGIIAAYSYAMTPYILLDNPDMPVLDAIRRSKDMMRGNKGRLFCLEISFIGWYFLCIFTCGIGFLWLHPYMSAATAAFYNDVSGKNRIRYEYNNGNNSGYNNYNSYNDNGYNNSYNNNGYNSSGYNNNGYNNNGYNNNGYNNNGYNNNGYSNSGNNNNGYNNNGNNNNGFNNNADNTTNNNVNDTSSSTDKPNKPTE